MTSEFNKHRGKYVHLITEYLQAIQFLSAEDAGRIIAEIKQELQVLQDCLEHDFDLSAESIQAANSLKDLYNMYNDADMYVQSEDFVDFRALIIEVTTDFLNNIQAKTPEQLATKINDQEADRSHKEKVAEQHVLATNKVNAASALLFSQTELALKAKYGIGKATQKSETEICVAAKEILQTAENFSIDLLHNAIRENILDKYLDFKTYEDPDELYSLEDIKEYLENISMVFNDSKITIKKFKSLPTVVQNFLLQDPYEAMDMVNLIAEKEFDLYIILLQKIYLQRLYAASSDPEPENNSAMLLKFIQDLIHNTLVLESQPECINIDNVNIILENMATIFKHEQFTIDIFNSFDEKLKHTMLENPDIILELVTKHGWPIENLITPTCHFGNLVDRIENIRLLFGGTASFADLKDLSNLKLLDIIDHAEIVSDYCAAFNLTLNEFLKLPTARIESLLSINSSRETQDTPIEAEIFTEIVKKKHQNVSMLIGYNKATNKNQSAVKLTNSGISYLSAATKTDSKVLKSILQEQINTETAGRFNGYIPSFGRQIDGFNQKGETPLTEAIKIGSFPTIQAVMARDADPTQPNSLGETPIELIMSRKDRHFLLPDMLIFVSAHNKMTARAKMQNNML